MKAIVRNSRPQSRFDLHKCEKASSRRWWGTALGVGLLILATSVHAQLSISDSGGPSYAQAIAVPPGQGGMSPKVGLVYSGGGVNGPVGYGWSLQGISAITRCAPNKAIDGALGAVTNTAADKLCLDGQRLIQTDATGAALAFPQTNDALGLGAGSYREFRTEKDSYARIRAYGYANSDTTGASGPAYFKVWTKAGQIYEYGASGSADANTKALISPYQKTVAVAWAVARISDTLSNFMDFKYEQRDVSWGSGTSAGPALGHEWNLLEIQYAGNKVVFTYADRGSTTPQDSAEAYHQGSKNVSRRLLKSVTTYINSSNTAALGPASVAVPVKTTYLTYTNGTYSKRSLISKIQECTGATTTRCMPETTFTYASGGDDSYQVNANFNQGTLSMQTTPGTAAFGVLTGDFNGDGRTDFIRWSDTPSQNQLYLSNGDGSFTQVPNGTGAGQFNITDQNLFRGDGCYQAILGDFNGDGLVDILSYAGNLTSSGGSCTTSGTSYIYLSNGDGSFTKKSISGVTLGRSKSALNYNCVSGIYPNCEPGDQSGWSSGTTFYLLDVNGDGKLDVITARLPGVALSTNPLDPCAPGVVCTHVFLGDGTGAFAEYTGTNLANKDLYSLPDIGYAAGQPSHVVDTDGDGLADLVGVGNPWLGTATSWRSNGDGNFVAAGYQSSCSTPIDFNGDGRSDCLVPNATAANAILFAATGAGTAAQVAGFNLVTAGQELAGAGAGIQIADINGDGRQDILRWKDDPTQNALYLSNGDGTFTASATFSLKLSTNQLSKSDGTAGFVLGDFTGNGKTEILQMNASPVANKLYVKTVPPAPDQQAPADQLLSAKSASGLNTTLYYVPLTNATPANGISGSYGSRYTTDRGTASAATGTKVDLIFPMYVVATSVADTGVGSSTVPTEYSYFGLKGDLNGRGFLGFRKINRQTKGAIDDTLTVITTYLQDHPYIGAASHSDTRWGTLNNAGAQLLSSTSNVYCDKTAAVGAETAATETAPCPVPTTVKVQRPYLRQTVETGADLVLASLPSTTTTYTLSATGDPTTIAVTTGGSVGGVNQSFTKTTTNTYYADTTNCSDYLTCFWILGRLSQATVASTVPNSLAQITTSAGTAPNATAIAGTGSAQAAALTPTLNFQSVNVGSSSTMTATLSSDGVSSLSVTVPGPGSVTGADYSFVATNCPSSLAAGANCTITVQLAPTGSNGTRTGTLAVTTGAGTLTSSLTGTATGGTSPPSIAISPTSWPAGNQLDGVTVSNNFTVTNSGGAGTYSQTLTINNGGAFGITGTNCPANGATMAANSTCSITVSFTGVGQCGGTATTRTATLTATAGSSSASASLTGINHVYALSSTFCKAPRVAPSPAPGGSN
jgi:hypothetical protein